jgi:hypothetical protein
MRKVPCTADGERLLQTSEPYWILGMKRKLCSNLLEVSEAAAQMSLLNWFVDVSCVLELQY